MMPYRAYLAAQRIVYDLYGGCLSALALIGLAGGIVWLVALQWWYRRRGFRHIKSEDYVCSIKTTITKN